ncbi:MAG: hypothetical protein M0Q44_01285 [Methylobacter sp.]|jgi:hypothetical protein|nr:hypothetical protein [Methylobacter sp.]
MSMEALKIPTNFSLHPELPVCFTKQQIADDASVHRELVKFIAEDSRKTALGCPIYQLVMNHEHREPTGGGSIKELVDSARQDAVSAFAVPGRFLGGAPMLRITEMTLDPDRGRLIDAMIDCLKRNLETENGKAN